MRQIGAKQWLETRQGWRRTGSRAESAAVAPPGRPWSAHAFACLSQALLAVSGMDDPGFRARLLRDVASDLGMPIPLPVKERDLEWDHVQEIVQALADLSDPEAGLWAVVQAVRRARPGSAALSWLEACVATLTQDGVLPAEEALLLWECLRSLDPRPSVALVQRLVDSVKDPDVFSPVRAEDGLADSFARLNLARVTPGRPPLVLAFLDRLGRHHGGEPGLRLRELTAAAAARMGWSAPAEPVGEPEAGRSMVLQVVLEQENAEAADEPRYSCELLLFDASKAPWRLVTKQAGAEAVSWQDLVRRKGRHLDAWLALAGEAGLADHLRVEFLLPWTLLGQAPEFWPVDADDYPVGMHCPVVVRSLDRLRTASWHRAWRSKWRTLMSSSSRNEPLSAAELMGWLVLPEDRAPLQAELTDRVLRVTSGRGEVRRWLDRRPSTASLALAFPYRSGREPEAHVHEAVKDAVREGIGAIIWRRDTGGVEELNDFLGELNGRELVALADHVHRRRRSAEESDAKDLGNNLTLLWDDPEADGWSAGPPLRPPAYLGGHHDSRDAGESRGDRPDRGDRADSGDRGDRTERGNDETYWAREASR